VPLGSIFSRFWAPEWLQNRPKIDPRGIPKQKVDEDAAEEELLRIPCQFSEPKSPKVLRIRCRNGAKIRKKSNQKAMEKSMPILIDLGCDF
jgi:hypothetical protein